MHGAWEGSRCSHTYVLNVILVEIIFRDPEEPMQELADFTPQLVEARANYRPQTRRPPGKEVVIGQGCPPLVRSGGPSRAPFLQSADSVSQVEEVFPAPGVALFLHLNSAAVGFNLG